MRLFVALLLDPGWVDVLARVQGELARLDPDASVRWVDIGAVHLTLKFLGEVAAERVTELTAALDARVGGRAAPCLALAGLGAFPNPRRPRVIWVGIREDGVALAPLQAEVENAAATLGWEREARAFQPHLTLGRVSDRRGRGPRGKAPHVPEALVRALATQPVPERPPVALTRLALVRSHLSPRGARYEELRVWSLAGASR